VSESCYEDIILVNSPVKSDHKAIVAYNRNIKTAVTKSRTYAKSFEYAVNTTFDVQQEFDRFYATVRDLHHLLDRFYSERTIVITPADPEFVTPDVKAMHGRKNILISRGRIDETDVLACRFGRAIIRYNSVELSHVNPKIRV